MVSSAGLGRSQLPDMFLSAEFPAGCGSMGAHQIVAVIRRNSDRRDNTVAEQCLLSDDGLIRLHRNQEQS